MDHSFWEGYPAWDEDMIAFGYIWVDYPDGSRKMFRHTDGSYGDGYWGNAKYYPYPKNNTGEYIVRTVETDDYDFEIQRMEYKLYTRDGSVLYFDSGYLSIPWNPFSYFGQPFGRVVAPMERMEDRFGNSLSFNWNYDKTAVTSVSDGARTIELDITNGYYTKAELKINSQVYRTVEYDWDDNNKIYTVTKTGYGVDANGVYDGDNLKQFTTKYQYEEIGSDGLNLTKVAYSGDVSKPTIEVDYDGYGRVETRKDYVDPGNYLITTFDYDFYHPDPNDKEISYLQTEATTSYRQVITVQDDRGNLIEYKTITFDGSAVTDVNSLYADSSNPLKPTDVNEYFDGMTRRTENDYSNYGDLVEQRIYVDDSNYVATAFAYHPDYSLETRQTSWQDMNKTGAIVDKLSIYGDADGEEDEHGAYLVKEKVLLSQDPNVWASTEYEYCDNGLVKKTTDPNGFVTFYEYDANDHLKLTRIGTVDSNEPVQRLYHDAIGQLRLAANSLGGVTLNDYDDFGRLWKIREYEDADAMSIADASFVPSRYEAMTPVSTVIYGYDQNGNRTYEQFAAAGEVLTEYTVSGLPSKVTYDDGSYVQNYYDSRGMKTEEYRSEASTSRDWLVEWLYDDMGRPIQTEWYDYDDANVAKAQASTYYGSGNIKNVTTYGYYSSPEKSTDYYYDILGRLTATVVAPGELDITTSYEYDATGNRVGVIDPNGSIIYFDYDNAKREIAEYFAAEVEADPNIKKQTFYYENGLVRDVNSYDYDGTLLAHSLYEYDARRRITKVVQDINDTEQAETCYDYNDSGFVVGSDSYQIQITDANSKETYVKLDEFGRRIKTLYPSDDYEELEYNGDGTLAAKAVWDANDTKHWIEYYCDGYARLIDVNYPDGGNVHYTYDGFGRKTVVEDNRNSTDNIGGSGEIAYEYDVLGRVVNITEQDGYQISYTYRDDGQKNSILVTEPNDANSIIYGVDYSYDAAGRLLNIMEPALGAMNDWIAEFGYDENGNRGTTS